jgi:hypothetical protein
MPRPFPDFKAILDWVNKSLQALCQKPLKED